ncbi:succinylglutamate desuccinylase [Paraglaciecola sp. 20A4]|uniref:succinylglutamate desuccinylase n=1 Tax=Paraglaciecola sp. 20A4 TaxID=2687288 RepID=UPI00140B9E37|nr:succinylglutamate desuccinylase [Paraglaciecola sp. 20A4]
MQIQDSSSIIKHLRETGQFLALSRSQPDVFKNSITFSLDNGTKVDVLGPGILSFTPRITGGKSIVLSSGIHGNETAPIEICDHYVVDILMEKIALAHRVLFIFGNLPAMDSATRFIDENLNRLFSGAHASAEVNQNSYECSRAKELEHAVSHFYRAEENSEERYHYDLHTAIRPSKNEKFAVYPFLHGKAHSREQLSFLLACGVDTFLLSGSTTTTFSYYSSHQFGAHAFTVELGKVLPFGQNDMSRFSQVRDTLERFICGHTIASKTFKNSDFSIYQVNQVINKTQHDFSLDFSDDLPNFSDFPAGTLLAHETGVEYRTSHDGEAVVFPNANVAIGQRAILTVIPTTLD